MNFDDTKKMNKDVPRYILVKEDILNKVSNGILKTNDRLMSRSEMEDYYGISASTINKALDELTVDGIIYRIKGKGTFVAKKKRRNDSKVIALIVPLNANPTETDIAPFLISAVGIGMRDTDYSLMVLDSFDEIKSLETAQKHGVSGIIMISYFPNRLNDVVKSVIDAGTPIVMLDRAVDDVRAGFVSTDHFWGSYSAVRSLISDGYKKIYHFSSNDKTSSIMQRRSGYTEAMISSDLNPDIIFIDTQKEDDLHNFEYQFRRALIEHQDILSSKCAIFTTNGDGLRGIWRAIIEEGIPYENLALATFDNPGILLPSDINFVDIIQDIESIGRYAVKILIQMIDNDVDSIVKILEPKIYKNGLDITDICGNEYKSNDCPRNVLRYIVGL